jgi:hypothetical protein
MALWFIKWNYRRFVPRSIYLDKLTWMPKAAEAVWSGFDFRGNPRNNDRSTG